MIYNKCLTEENKHVTSRKGYAGEGWEIENFTRKNSFYRYEHEHRRWEYGLCVCLINEFHPKTMLNVGGGNSPISSWAVEKGIGVTEIDPNKPSVLLPGIDYIHDTFPQPGLGQHELVICTSVIEHVENNDEDFFVQLLEHSFGLVYLTTDFHPSGKQFSYAHYRTYSEEGMRHFIDIGRKQGFSPIGEIDYKYDGPMVYDYTFAALALRKQE